MDNECAQFVAEWTSKGLDPNCMQKMLQLLQMVLIEVDIEVVKEKLELFLQLCNDSQFDLEDEAVDRLIEALQKTTFNNNEVDHV